jgi:CheY-like chemotaxis protein
LAGKHVVIAEDYVYNQNIIASVVESLNCTVTLLRDGEELVMNYLNYHETIDFILTDLDMPRRNGFDAVSTIRRFERQHNLPEVPIIILTGNGSKRN